MTIPIEASELASFTPESLLPMGDAAPVFKLKAPSERCLRKFRQEALDDGLEQFSQDEFTEEKLRAIAPPFWSEDVAQAYRDRLRAIVETSKQNIAVSAEDMAWAQELDDALFECHRPLRVMRRKTSEFHERAPIHALRVYVASWSGLGTPIGMEAGVLGENCVEALRKELTSLGRMHCPEAPTTPFLELYVAATKRLSLDEDEEKNSPAPSQPTSILDASKKTASTAGKSTEANSVDSPVSITSNAEIIPDAA